MRVDWIRLAGFLATSILALSGCGGSGSGDVVTASPDTIFLLNEPEFAEPGGSRTFNLSGTTNQGVSLSSTISTSRQADTVFNGQAARQFDTLITISFTGGGTIAVSTTAYETPDGRFLGSVDNDTGVQGFPAGPQSGLPESATIGAFGFLGNTSYSDGSTSSANWRLDPQPGSTTRAQLVEFISAQNPSFDAVSTRVIDTAGHTVSIKVSFFYPDGLVVDLSS